MSGEKTPGVQVGLHGPGVTIEDAIEAGEATKRLLREVGESMGVEVDWQVASVFFQCDGCGLRRADRPSPDEGWTYSDGNDYCPACSEASA